MRLMIAAVLTTILSSAAQAQSHQHQPYADLQSRSIKALSEQQIFDLRDGKGMSLALAAELNGYPGPSHVLEYAEWLNLTDWQRQSVQALFTLMLKEARAVGARLIMQESHLDTLFKSKQIDSKTLTKVTNAIGETQAELRATHLKYHLTTAELLTPDQNKRYAELRGYGLKN